MEGIDDRRRSCQKRNRMMTVASLLKDGIELSFADGSTGLIPYADVPEIKERVAVSSLELPNPYEMVLETAQGRTGRDSLGTSPVTTATHPTDRQSRR